MKFGFSRKDGSVLLEKMAFLTNIDHKLLKYAMAFLRRTTTDDEKHARFWRYFEATWMTKYPVEMWSYWNSRSGMVSRTNNALERYNRTLGEMCVHAHPSTVNLVQIIRDQFALYSAKMNNIRRGTEKVPQHDGFIMPTVPSEFLEFVHGNNITNEVKVSIVIKKPGTQ